MKRNTMSYKVRQFLMFAGIPTVLFIGVIIIPFIYGLYLTFTSWDGVSRAKPRSQSSLSMCLHSYSLIL